MVLYLYEIWLYPTMDAKDEIEQIYDMNSLEDALEEAYDKTPVGGYQRIMGMDWDAEEGTVIDGWGHVIKKKVGNTIKTYYDDWENLRVLYPKGRVGEIVRQRRPASKFAIRRSAAKKAAINRPPARGYTILRPPGKSAVKRPAAKRPAMKKTAAKKTAAKKKTNR